MQRVTITLDDDLLETLDSLSQRRGYNNRSEAIRDILRSALSREHTGTRHLWLRGAFLCL